MQYLFINDYLLADFIESVMIDSNKKRGMIMGLKVTRQTDLTGLFDKFASLPTDKAQPVDTDKETAETKKNTKVQKK